MNNSKKQYYRANNFSIALLITSAMVCVIAIFLIFNQTKQILTNRLQQRLVAIASTASVSFDPKVVESSKIPQDLEKPEIRKMINHLKAIRENNSDVKYAYIFVRSDEPNKLLFAGDADMLNNLEELDTNNNGIVDPEEAPPAPGDPYDISDLPIVAEGFTTPVASSELGSDKWGTYMSGFAPIKDENGHPIAVIGVDVEVKDFTKIITVMLTPFSLMAALLLMLLTFQTVTISRIWKERLRLTEEIDHQKDELLSMVSHQLAAPITAMKWYLELLLDGDTGVLTAEQQEQLHTMQSITTNLSDLVSMILDVSRIELGRMRVESQEFELSELFEEIFSVIEPRAKDKKIKFTKKYSSPLPKIKLDRRLTRMALENILANAIKYTPEKGSVTISAKIERQFLVIAIEDTGCGIPKKEQGQVFQKLFRASNVRNKIEGNGFGMYVAKGAIESQHGRLTFVSNEGKGTCFTMELPYLD